jgi:hypothetical protein
LTPRTSMMSSSKQPTVTPPRSMAGTSTPYAGAGNYNNPSEFSDLDLALQQKLVSQARGYLLSYIPRVVVISNACRFQLEIDRPKSSVGYNMQELMFDGSRSKTSPPQGMRSDRQSVRTSPGTRDEKDIASYRKPFNFVKVPSNMSDTTSTKRVAAMISQPEKSLDAQQSSCKVLSNVLTMQPSYINLTLLIRRD